MNQAGGKCAKRRLQLAGASAAKPLAHVRRGTSLRLNPGAHACRPSQGHGSWNLGGIDPWKPQLGIKQGRGKRASGQDPEEFHCPRWRRPTCLSVSQRTSSLAPSSTKEARGRAGATTTRGSVLGTRKSSSIPQIKDLTLRRDNLSMSCERQGKRNEVLFQFQEQRAQDVPQLLSPACCLQSLQPLQNTTRSYPGPLVNFTNTPTHATAFVMSHSSTEASSIIVDISRLSLDSTNAGTLESIEHPLSFENDDSLKPSEPATPDTSHSLEKFDSANDTLLTPDTSHSLEKFDSANDTLPTPDILKKFDSANDTLPTPDTSHSLEKFDSANDTLPTPDTSHSLEKFDSANDTLPTPDTSHSLEKFDSANDTLPTPDTSHSLEKFDSANDTLPTPDTYDQEPVHQQGCSGPQDLGKPPEEHHHPQLFTSGVPPMDAWADQGHFPPLLGEASRKSIPCRGGSHVVLTGVNFREGVEVVFECPQLHELVEAKVVKPRVLKSTEMEFIAPNLLEWWAIANCLRPCKELSLSVTLICAGAKHDDDADTTFEMLAVEESETDLLHVILGLHRQLIQASLSSSLDPETDSTKRQRTLALLNLEQPPNVSRSEHLALGVIYMLCNGYDQISAEGMDIIRGTTEDGHDMLHLAVIQGQTTLVREIARHSLAWFQSHDLTEESEIFTRNPNGDTALDYAKILGLEEIEHVLIETLVAALEFKNSTLQIPPRPLPALPATSRPGTMIDGAGSHHRSWIPPRVLDRPLPPTPMILPYPEPGLDAQRAISYFTPVPTSDDRTRSQIPHFESTESVATTAMVPPQRVQTAQAIIEDDLDPNVSHGAHQSSSAQNNTVHYGMPTAASLERLRSGTYPGQAPSHIESHPSYEQYQYEHHQPTTYGETLHNIPPVRANSAPLPRPSDSQSQQPPQAIYRSSVARFRPLPPTPHPPAAPLLPPRHKVTRVTRPQQFTVPTNGGAQVQSQPALLQHRHTLAVRPVQQQHHHQYHSEPLQMPVHQHPTPMSTQQHPIPMSTQQHPIPMSTQQHPMPVSAQQHPIPMSTQQYLMPVSTQQHPMPMSTQQRAISMHQHPIHMQQQQQFSLPLHQHSSSMQYNHAPAPMLQLQQSMSMPQHHIPMPLQQQHRETQMQASEGSSLRQDLYIQRQDQDGHIKVQVG